METQAVTTAAPQENNKVQPIEALKNILNAPSVQEQFKNALKENSGSFVAGVIDLFSNDKTLKLCAPKQVVMECLKAAILKLPINKSLGFAYIVPFKSGDKHIATFIMGYKGYIQLAMRTGQYRFINTDVVYEGELKKVNKLTGEIDFTGEKTSDTVVGYFSYIEMNNGFSKTLYMTKKQVDDHAKKYSKSYGNSSSTWKTDFEAMAKKTVLRNLLSHYGFLSVEMINAFDNEDRSEIAENANMEEVNFDDAEVVSTTVNAPAETPADNTAQPGF